MSWNGISIRGWKCAEWDVDWRPWLTKGLVNLLSVAGWVASAEWVATKLGMSEGPYGQNGRRRMEHLFMCKWCAAEWLGVRPEA